MASIIRTHEEDDRLRVKTYYPPCDRAHLARCREAHKWNVVKDGNQWDRLFVKCTWWNVFLTKAVAWLIFQVLRPVLPIIADPKIKGEQDDFD
jgi:hypothetical protein